MKTAIRTTLTGLLLLAALPAGAAQRPVEESALPVGELALRYYTPRDVDRDELVDVAEELFGERLLVLDARGQLDNVHRFLKIEYSILVRDEVARAEEILATLAEIEESLYPSDPEEPQAEGRSRLESFEYAPRFLSSKSVYNALGPYRREIRMPPPPGGGAYTDVDNIDLFEERNMIFVRETPEKLGEIRALLEAIDTPVPQATFSFMVIRGLAAGDAGGGSELPAELTQHLRRMVPVQGFDLLATGVLRSSTRDRLQLEMRADDTTQFELSLDPAAFDREGGELTVRRFRFQVSTLVRGSDPESGETREHQGFETAFSLRGGEYTVLGSVGEDPLFAVLRMDL